MTDQRVVLITGGAKRVGRAMVEGLTQSGFKVAFTYNSSQADADLIASATDAFPIRADLTNPESATQFIYQSLAEKFGRLDVLVNNASLYLPATLNQTDVEISRRLMAIHYESPLLLAKSFELHLRKSGGHIVNMLDLLAEKPLPQYLAYCASKAALWNLTLALARELSPEVTVNGIAPGVVEWPPDYPQADRANYLKRVPLSRAGSPTDVVNLVRFIITSAPYITGQIFRLDGGRSLT